jgi:hypothetical protein
MHRVVRTLFHGPNAQGIANTIVQLICQSTSGVIVSPHPIRSDKRHFRKRAAPTLRSPSKIFNERMANTCQKQPGNLTRNMDS